MRLLNSSSTSLVCLLGLCLAAPGTAQIVQNHPELCGKPDQLVPTPPGVTVDVSGLTNIIVTLGTGDTQKRIELPGFVEEVHEVCPLDRGRILLFGSIGDSAYDFILLDANSGTLLGRSLAYDPAVSPDQHWLAYRVFHPRHTELPYMELYMLYDLTKDAAGNQPPGVDPNYVHAKGRLMYPSVPNHVPFEEFDLPPEQLHESWSDGYFWAPDSKSLLFADRVADKRTAGGKFSLVWVKIGPKGEPEAYVHSISEPEICGKELPEIALRLSKGVITPRPSGTEIWAEFRPGNGACTSKGVLLRDADFAPAEIQQPPPPRKRKPASVQVQKRQ